MLPSSPKGQDTTQPSSSSLLELKSWGLAIIASPFALARQCWRAAYCIALPDVPTARRRLVQCLAAGGRIPDSQAIRFGDALASRQVALAQAPSPLNIASTSSLWFLGLTLGNTLTMTPCSSMT
jgi:hypothetical protein